MQQRFTGLIHAHIAEVTIRSVAVDRPECVAKVPFVYLAYPAKKLDVECLVVV